MSYKNKHEVLKRKDWDSRESVTKDRYKSKRGQIENQLEKEALVCALNGKRYEYALDVGIGDGRLVQVYAPYIDRLLGIDISENQLKYAIKHTNILDIDIEFKVCGDASKLEVSSHNISENKFYTEIKETGKSKNGLPSNSFDLVICSRVLQHVENWQLALAEQCRVLKPGGSLLLLLYNRFSIYGLKKLYEHLFINPLKGNFRNPLNIRRELNKNGFIIEYYAGALMAQPELFPNNLSTREESFIRWVEKFGKIAPFKYFGGRQVILAKKSNM